MRKDRRDKLLIALLLVGVLCLLASVGFPAEGCGGDETDDDDPSVGRGAQTVQVAPMPGSLNEPGVGGGTALPPSPNVYVDGGWEPAAGLEAGSLLYDAGSPSDASSLFDAGPGPDSGPELEYCDSDGLCEVGAGESCGNCADCRRGPVEFVPLNELLGSSSSLPASSSSFSGALSPALQYLSAQACAETPTERDAFVGLTKDHWGGNIGDTRDFFSDGEAVYYTNATCSVEDPWFGSLEDNCSDAGLVGKQYEYWMATSFSKSTPIAVGTCAKNPHRWYVGQIGLTCDGLGQCASIETGTCIGNGHCGCVPAMNCSITSYNYDDDPEDPGWSLVKHPPEHAVSAESCKTAAKAKLKDDFDHQLVYWQFDDRTWPTSDSYGVLCLKESDEEKKQTVNGYSCGAELINP